MYGQNSITFSDREVYEKYKEVQHLMKVIVAEKPDVAKQLRNALEPSAKAVKFAEKVYYYMGERFIFVPLIGHLFRAQYPQEINEDYKQWKIEKMNLPEILPLKIISPIANTYFKCVKEVTSRKDIDEVVVCTDPDREGQLIWALIEKNLNIKVPITRATLKEQTPKGRLKAYNSRKPNSNYKSLEEAGLGRMQADYLIGLHATRANTVAFGGFKNIVNEGRVQSPTRYMVYLNDKEIKNFKPEDYAVLQLETESDEDKGLVLSSGRLTKEDAEKIKEVLPGNQFKMTKVEKDTKKEAPKLYKTNTVLIDASNKCGISATRTTEILQTLYQNYGLTTYPRTGIEQISVSSAEEVMKIVDSLDGAGIVDDIINEIKEKKLTYQKHLINTKGGDMPHEAITPTFDGDPKRLFDKLSKDEKEVYILIAKRFLQGFYPPAVISETKVTTSINYNNEKIDFGAKGKAIKEPSWMKISGIPNDKFIPSVTDGHSYLYIDSKIQMKQTKPPSRFTNASLLDAMENAGKYVDDKEAKKILKKIEGIGTGATQQGIIDNLLKNNFLVLKGNSIYPTEKTIQLTEILPNSPLTSPLMTAELETKLSMVESGELTFHDFMTEVNKQVDDIIEATKNSKKTTISSGVESIGKCPYCSREMRESKTNYYCPGYKDNSCQFIIKKEYKSKKLTKANVKQLLEKGRTKKMKGFVSDKGKPFEAALVRNDDKRRIEYDFS